MKKIVAICSIVILSLFVGGCVKTIELTDEESKLVAEYAAELLLKYDRNNDSKYYNDEYSDIDPFATTEYLTTETLTTEAIITEEPTTQENQPENPEQSGNSDITGGQPLEQEGVVNSNSNTTENVSGIVADADKNFNLGAFIGEDKVSIKYEYYMVLDEYPSYDQDGVFITIEAPQGYKLIVVKFKLENLTNEDQQLDLYSKDVDYRIIVDNSKSAKQMLTILIDDLYTYEGTVAASMYNEAVLLFQVSEDIALNVEDLKLKATYNGEDVIISLQ